VRGSASVTAVGIVAVALVGTTAVAAVGHATTARVALEAAADAAALAGADAVAGFVSDDPCRVVARAATLNAAGLVSCAVSGPDVDVIVGRTILGFSVTARARAGPPPGLAPQ
jgi:secretion/DNA translocation related TadE-like protein